MICCPSVDTPRSKVSVPIATRQPSPGWPTTRAASVRASSKNTSLNSAVPVIWMIGRTSTPGWSSGTSRYDSPACRLEPFSVRATTKHHCDRCASEVHTFWPLITHWSPSSSAVVDTLARSLPAPGSEYPWHHSSVTSRMRGRKRCCCSGVPNAINVGPSNSSPKWLTLSGASTRAYSS